MCVINGTEGHLHTRLRVKIEKYDSKKLQKVPTFHCLSNVKLPIATIPLKHNWIGWWSKVELFRPNLFNGSVFYPDLDIIICKNFEYILDKLDYKILHMIKKVLNPTSGNANSSIMSWQGDYSAHTKIFNVTSQAIMSNIIKET